MAWTWSAPDRGTVAAAMLATSAHQSLHNALSYLGKGDLTRGLCVAFAVFLTAAGALATHVPPLALTAFLFLTGAGLATAAATGMWTGLSGVHSRSFSDVKGCAPSAPRTTALAQSEIRPATFSELVTCADRKSTLDRAAWARLTAHMSHELRTPLNAVLGFSELMSNEVFGPMGSACYAEYARDIHASGRMLLKSAEDALAITALLTAPERKGQLPATLLNSALDDALAFNAPDAASLNIAITTTLDRECEILAEAQTVRQLLINLLADATSRAAPGAQIEISSQLSAGQVGITLTLRGTRDLNALRTESFPLILAETLSELSGARLTCGPALNGTWQAAASFVPAAQRDFFALGRSFHS